MWSLTIDSIILQITEVKDTMFDFFRMKYYKLYCVNTKIETTEDFMFLMYENAAMCDFQCFVDDNF